MRRLYGLPNLMYDGKGNLVTLSFPPFVDFRKTPYTLAFSMGEEKVPFYSLVGMKMLRKENGWIKVFYLGQLFFFFKSRKNIEEKITMKRKVQNYFQFFKIRE